MTTTSTSRTRSPITMTSSESQQQLGPLEPPHDGRGEAGAGDAEMDVALDDELSGRRVERSVERRMLGERERGRLQQEGRERERHAARLRALEIALDDCVQLGDVRAIEMRDVRDHRRRQG